MVNTYERASALMTEVADRLAALASAPAFADGGKPITPAGDGVPAWHGEASHNALLASSAPVERTKLGDLPSRIQGWIGKARARGGDRIELDFATVELLVAAALARPPAAVGEQSREAIARIIAPEKWQEREGYIRRQMAHWQYNADAVVRLSLDKADAILALQSPPAKVEGA
ncbi:hypothetical protein ASE67_02725 [Sphingomonas sp. Leaf23]|nr:hypothetical protein ASE67_02725 [Sphingomonas sp. Leaf23]